MTKKIDMDWIKSIAADVKESWQVSPGVWQATTKKVAEKIATVEMSKKNGGEWIVVERNDSASKFYIERMHQLGDHISYTFNGDYYPAGQIASISPKGNRIQTTTGEVFHGSKDRMVWKRQGGTFVMVRGHMNKRNPNF